VLQVDLEQHDWFYEFPLASTNVYVQLVIHITSVQLTLACNHARDILPSRY
jgi:hypothetical protein